MSDNNKEDQEKQPVKKPKQPQKIGTPKSLLKDKLRRAMLENIKRRKEG